MKSLSHVEVLGGGPAGLYVGILLKRAFPEARVRLSEQNPADATFGFGVVFSAQALDFLKADDPDTHALITPGMERWSNMTLVHRGETVTIDGVGFSAIGRLELLMVLQARAREAGVELVYDHRVENVGALQAETKILARPQGKAVVALGNPLGRVLVGFDKQVLTKPGVEITRNRRKTFPHTVEHIFVGDKQELEA